MKTETAERKNIGNMKGIAEEELSSGRIRMRAGNRLVYLSGAEMDLKTAPVIRKSLSAFAQNGLYGFTIQDHRYNQAVCWWMKKTRYLQLEETASATFSGDRIDRIESPALGPTPETAVSILKQLRCSSFKKP